MLPTSSKFRHVFATVASKPELQYRDIKVASTITDVSNFIAANARFFAVSWNAGGGGKLAVIEMKNLGKISSDVPCVTGHCGPILDWAFHPFAENIIATASEDTTVKIWTLPDSGLTSNIDTPSVTLTGHCKKVTMCKFVHLADHVLATTGFDHLLKLWDIENGEKISLDMHKDQIMSFDFNLEANQMVSSCRDKKIRVLDPRSNSLISETVAHAGSKTQKAIWAKRKDKIITIGFNKTQEREVFLWDPRNLSKSYYSIDLDNASGVMMPFFDEDTNMLYLGGKGDGNIRLFELWDNEPPLCPLTDHSSPTPQRGLCCLPKHALDTTICEVARFLKLETDKVVPISFQCPRKQALQEFQSDVYPLTFSKVATMSASEYFSGKTCQPNTELLQHGTGTTGATASLSPVIAVAKTSRIELEAQRNKVASLRAHLLEEEKMLASMEALSSALI